jgi:hypothetical protein
MIAAVKLGRVLLPGEHVHHIDGDRTNNAPANLDVLSQSDHRSRHQPTPRKRKRAGAYAVPEVAGDPFNPIGISLDDAATRLGVHHATAYRMAMDGSLEITTRVPRSTPRILVSEDSVTAMLDATTAKPQRTGAAA